MAGVITYFACKTWFWKQEALFNFKMWKKEEQYTSKLFSQLCQLGDRVHELNDPEIARINKLDFEAVMDKLGFTETALEPVPDRKLVMYAGKFANLTISDIKLFHDAHERVYPGRGEVLLYL